MSSTNFTRIFIRIASLIMLTLAAFSVAQNESYDLVITIDVAPNILCIQSNGQVVTVHTDIAYSVVEGSTVYLNNVAIRSWKSDLRGYFVAKFEMSEIKSLPLDIGGYNTLTLVGSTTSGKIFQGSQDILVIESVPKNR